MLSTQHVDMISIPDTELHLQRRRAWARGLAAKALREYEERMGGRVGQLVGWLEEHGLEKKELKMSAAKEWITVNVPKCVVGLPRLLPW